MKTPRIGAALLVAALAVGGCRGNRNERGQEGEDLPSALRGGESDARRAAGGQQDTGASPRRQGREAGRSASDRQRTP